MLTATIYHGNCFRYPLLVCESQIPTDWIHKFRQIIKLIAHIPSSMSEGLGFCSHGNLIVLGCPICKPSEKPQPKIEADLDCPAHELISSTETNDLKCNNKGCIEIKTTPKQRVFRCLDCGWEWKKWKNGKLVIHTLPKLVECVNCNRIVLEPISRSSDSTCNQCGRVYFRENYPKYVRD